MSDFPAEPHTSSPYTGSPYSRRTAILDPAEFFGRRRELETIYGLICRKTSLYLLGERRTGKSSLLNALRFPRDPGEFPMPVNPCYIFWNSLYFSSSDESRLLRQLFSQISRELTAPIFDPVRESLPEAGEFARHARRQLIVLIDEFDVLVRNPAIPRDFFGVLRAWAEEFEIPFVIACREGSIEGLLDTNQVGSPFWNILQNVYVGPMSQEESMELISTPAANLDRPFSDEDLDQIQSWGGHHPFFLQMAADHTFRASGREEQKRNFLQEADVHYDYIFSVLPERELAYLRGNRNDSRAESELLRKGILIRDEKGERLFSSLFRDKIIVQPTSFLEQVKAFYIK
jgi:Novel STAND NTPase 2